MTSVSTHLHRKPYQVATARDPTLPFRKWDRLGTHWDVTALNAAYKFLPPGARVCRGAESPDPEVDRSVDGVWDRKNLYYFSDGTWIAVGF